MVFTWFFIVIVLFLFLLVGGDDSCFGMYNGLMYDFNKGDSWSNLGKCVLHRCKGDNLVTVQRCPEVTLQKGCVLSKPDLTKYFPGCCPYPICTATDAEECQDSGDGSRHQPGDQWQPEGRCVHKECVGGGLTLVSTCTYHELHPGYSYTEIDLTQKFPKCCPRVIKENGRSDEEE